MRGQYRGHRWRSCWTTAREETGMRPGRWAGEEAVPRRSACRCRAGAHPRPAGSGCSPWPGSSGPATGT
eukprot:1136204-Rhodomonas_salina.1